MRVLVTGASGFIGTRLCPALSAAGHDVRAMTRHPEGYAGAGTPVFGDVSDAASLPAAMADCDAAYYLVHSLDAPDFVRRDAEAALAFGRAAREAGLRRIVYLGGLGVDSDELSAHLRSRREVERLLIAAGVPVTVLRAGIVLGAGGLSFELLRQLVSRLPVMVTPRWVTTRSQPIAVTDVVAYLVAVLDLPEAAGHTYEVGGPEVLAYREMLARVAKALHRPHYLRPLPLLTPRLSSAWLALVTDVTVPAARALIDSMTNEVVVHEPAIQQLVPRELLGFDAAVALALAEGRGRDRAAG